MGYYQVDGERWQEFLKIPDEEVPERLIIEGHIHFPKCIERRGQVLSHVREAWMPNLVLGEFEGELVGYGVCFGGPIASQFAHIYCKLGTRKVVQIGICGGLQPGIELGDLVVSEGVLSLDGVARLYRRGSDFVGFDAGLCDAAVEELGRMGVVAHRGSTVSYYDILLEEAEDLEDLSRRGYLGVEMEAAATAAVASHFGTPAVSVLTVSDNSISGKDLFYRQSDAERDRIQEGMETMFQVALRI